MSAGIPRKFEIDFSRYAKDMSAKAWTRMLAQHWASPVLRQFIAAFIESGPLWAYDEIVKQQEANSLYRAEGFNLEAIGRIVGQPRIASRYDESRWFSADRPGQGADQAFVWVRNAPLVSNTPAGDAEYRQMILARIVCNFNRFSSLPEMAYAVRFTTGETVSYRRIGPMEVELLVRAGISRVRLETIIRRSGTVQCDDVFVLPYPATINLKRVLYVPARAFISDRGNGHQADAGSVAVGRDLN